MRWSDILWLAKEIWPWTVGVISVGLAVGVATVNWAINGAMKLAVALSIPTAIAFWLANGWTEGGAEGMFMGLAFMGIPAAAVVILVCAIIGRLGGKLVSSIAS